MKKTLAQLKRDLREGAQLKVVDYKARHLMGVKYYTDYNRLNHAQRVWSDLVREPVPEKLHGIRTIDRTQSNGVVVEGSFFGFPESKHITYIDDLFVVDEYSKRYGLTMERRTYQIINP